MRMGWRLGVLLIGLGCARGKSSAPASSTAESEVGAAESARFAAMLKQDVAALDTLLEPDVSYIHTGGEQQSKAEFIDMIRSKALVYEAIVPRDVRVRVYHRAAVATGLSQMTVRSGTNVSTFGIRFTETYVHRGGRWLLAAWEATRLSGG